MLCNKDCLKFASICYFSITDFVIGRSGSGVITSCYNEASLLSHILYTGWSKNKYISCYNSEKMVKIGVHLLKLQQKSIGCFWYFVYSKIRKEFVEEEAELSGMLLLMQLFQLSAYRGGCQFFIYKWYLTFHFDVLIGYCLWSLEWLNNCTVCDCQVPSTIFGRIAQMNLSVCLFVSLSQCALWRNYRTYCPYFDSTWYQQTLVGNVPFHLKFVLKLTHPPLNSANFNQCLLITAEP